MTSISPRRRAADTFSPSERSRALMAFRLAAVTVVIALAWWSGFHPSTATAAVIAVYLGLTLLLTALVHVARPGVRTAAFTAVLAVDAVHLQLQSLRLGATVAVDLVVAAYVVAVCLLGSATIGLRFTVVLSVCALVTVRAQQTGWPALPGGAASAADPTTGAVTDLALLWLVALTTAVGAWVHQRELLRRRLDAEALQRFAAALHHDTAPAGVADRVLRFAVEDLRARRGVVVVQSRDGLELLAGHGVGPGRHAAPGGVSSALGLASLSRKPTPLRPDPVRDPWLCGLLPDARRVVVARLDVGLEERMWLVVEPHPARGTRLERRFVAALCQAAGATALALSRVHLLTAARAAAARDPLTGVANRRGLEDVLDALSRRSRAGGEGFAVVMVDVDRFKTINDTLGHQVGDDVLRQVAATLAGQLRRHELIARYGGEEFSVVLPDADTATAVAVAERLRRSLQEITDPITVTASFGVASVPADASDGLEATALADAALLRAKAAGRDRVVAAFDGPGGSRDDWGHPAAAGLPPPRTGGVPARMPAPDWGEGAGTVGAGPGD
jgi:diguanylate cyclase (GGDEF)-like protein